MSSSTVPDDPESLTIPNLINLLTEHGVEVPSKREKKSFYIDLFHNELVPKLGKNSSASSSSSGVARRRSNVVSPRKGRSNAGTGTPVKETSFKSPPRARSTTVESSAASASENRSPPPNITTPKLLQQVSLSGGQTSPRRVSIFTPVVQPPAVPRSPTSPPRRPPSFSASTTFEGFTPVPPPAHSATRAKEQSPPRSASFAAAPRAPRRGSISSDLSSLGDSSSSYSSPSGSFSRGSSAKVQSKYSIVFFVFVIAVEVALALFLAKYISFGALWSFLLPHTVPFCDTYVKPSASQQLNCTACPLNAKCENGVLIGCDAGYKPHRSGTSCIRDTDLDTKVSVLRDRMVDLLAARAGEVDCKVRESSDLQISNADMREWARKNVLSRASESEFDEIFARVSRDAKTDATLHCNEYSRWYTTAPKVIPIWCRVEKLVMRSIFGHDIDHPPA